MRHKKKGRRLGRTSSHRKAMLRNLATALFLTERDESYYEDNYSFENVTQKSLSPKSLTATAVTQNN